MHKAHAFFAAAVLLCAARPVRAEDILVGFSAPVTGVAAAAAMWQRWGVQIALDEVNNTGGVLGRPLRIVEYDNRCSPSEAVNVANRLVHDKVVAIIGSHCSSATLAAMPIVADARIPMVEGVATSPRITELSGVGGNPWTFRINPSDTAMMEAIGAYLKQAGTFHKLAVVAEDTDYGRGGAAALQAVAARNGLEIVSTDFFLQNTPDFTSMLTRLRQARPDAIALFQLAGDQLNFLRTAMQMGIHIPFTGRVEIGGKNEDIIKAGGLDNAVSDWSYSADVHTPENDAFVAEVKRRFDASPVAQSWAGHDQMKVIAQAIREAGSVDPSKIRDALAKTHFTTLLGKDTKFDDHNQAGKAVVISSVKDRKATVVEVLDVK